MLIWSVKDIVDVIERCVENKFDVILFVEGNRGLGKSTLLYKIGLRLNTHGIVKFEPSKDITYAREETIKRLASNTKRFIFADEMINVAYNRDFYESDQKVLLKALNMYRDSCNVFAGAIPKFQDLDTQIRRLCKMRITITRRGVGFIHTQIRGIYRDDPWDTKENQKKEGAKVFRGKATPYAKLSTVRGMVRFGDLSAQQREKYESIKQDKRGQVYKEYTDDNPDPEQKFYDTLLGEIYKGRMDNEKLLTVCTMFGRKMETVKTTLRSRIREDPDHCNKKLAELLKKEIKPPKIRNMLIGIPNNAKETKDHTNTSNNLNSKSNEIIWD